MEKEEYLARHAGILQGLNKLGLTSDIVDFRPYINTMSEYLPNKREALMRFSTGLQIVADSLIEKPKLVPLGIVYQTLASLSAVQAVENGLNLEVHHFHIYNVAQKIGDVEYGPDKLMTINQAAGVSKTLQDRGITLGLVHGHFRLPTPSSIAFIINSHREARVILTGVESRKRTEEFKMKEVILTDEERVKTFRTLMPFVFQIGNETEYSNAGYRELVRKISPNVYIGQSDNPPELKAEMQVRASLVEGCRYAEIVNLPGLSTSEMYDELMRVGGGQDYFLDLFNS